VTIQSKRTGRPTAGLPSAVGDEAGRGPLAGGARIARAFRRRSRLWFTLPSILLVLVFFAGPFVANTIFAFLNWTGYSNTISWAGLSNFKLVNELGILKHAIVVTLIYAITTMTVQNAVSLPLATALQETNRVNTVFRSLFFIPVLISPLAAGYIWAAVLSPQGPFNAFLSVIVPGGFHYSWLGNNLSALITVAAIDAWKWTGLVTLVYIAGLSRIPRTLIEAATLDGAGAWRRFWSIKFPLLAPAFTFNVVVTLVGALSAFDVIMSTTGGGPGDATTVLNIAVYGQYGHGYFGTASALSLVVSILAIGSAVPLMAWLRRREVQL
jgi:multiple sugar transport system permease protein/raffinose/stachyose/melibiose transport system permease protein